MSGYELNLFLKKYILHLNISKRDKGIIHIVFKFTNNVMFKTELGLFGCNFYTLLTDLIYITIFVCLLVLYILLLHGSNSLVFFFFSITDSVTM